MGTKRHGRRTQIGGQFSPYLIEMLECPAYRVLSLTARRVMARLDIELGHHGGKDNGRLPCTFEQFVKYGIDRHAIAPALRELEALGFIEVTEHGHAGNREFRSSNKFRLTYQPTEEGGQTHEWRRIKTPEQAELIAAQARRAKKQNPNAGKRTTSMMKTDTETENSR